MLLNRRNSGIILACGICVQSGKREGSEMCLISTMKAMYEVVKEIDRVVTF